MRPLAYTLWQQPLVVRLIHAGASDESMCVSCNQHRESTRLVHWSARQLGLLPKPVNVHSAEWAGRCMCGHDAGMQEGDR